MPEAQTSSSVTAVPPTQALVLVGRMRLPAAVLRALVLVRAAVHAAVVTAAQALVRRRAVTQTTI